MGKDLGTLTFDTFTDLRTVSGTQSSSVTVLGKDTINDDEGGKFYWDEASTLPDDNNNIIQKTGLLTGRWIRAELKGVPVTKQTIGLGNVDNTSDMNKPVSTLQAAAISSVQSQVTTHTTNTNNPHNTTKAQVGLGNVDNTSDINKPVSTAQAAADQVILNQSKTYADTTVLDAANEYSDNKDALVLQDSKDYTDDYIATILSGTLNVNPSDSPQTGVNNYNANVEGDYTNFGLEVTEGDINGNLVQFRRIGTTNTFEKIITPITGPTIKVVTFNPIVKFDEKAKFSSTLQTGDINFTLDNTGTVQRSFYEVEIETNGDDINFSSDFDLQGEVDLSKNIYIIFYKSTLNSKIQATIVSVDKGGLIYGRYRIGGTDLAAQKARSFVEWIRFNDGVFPYGAFAYNVGFLNIDGIDYFFGSVATNPASPSTSRVGEWGFEMAGLVTGGEYTSVDGNVTVKIGSVLPATMLLMGNYNYPMELIIE